MVCRLLVGRRCRWLQCRPSHPARRPTIGVPRVGPGTWFAGLGHSRGCRRSPTLHELTAATIVGCSWMPGVGCGGALYRQRAERAAGTKNDVRSGWSAASCKPWGTFWPRCKWARAGRAGLRANPSLDTKPIAAGPRLRSTDPIEKKPRGARQRGWPSSRLSSG